MKKQTPGRPFASDKNLKKELIISAIKLFAENDIGNVSVKDIASIFKTSEYKIRHIICLTAKKIAKYNGLSEDVEHLSHNY